MTTMSIVILLMMMFASSNAFMQQAVAVKGKLMCGSQPAANVRIKLWDEDDGIDPDELLDSGFTDANGMFELKGTERELTTIDPVFKIYHDCNDGNTPGQRKVKLRIPDSYVNSGTTAKKVFDIGILNLETVFKAEERELITS